MIRFWLLVSGYSFASDQLGIWSKRATSNEQTSNIFFVGS